MTIWELIALAKAGDGGAKSMLHFKGSVLTESALPESGDDGDTYLVDSADSYFAWDGEGWTDVGQLLSMDDVAALFDQVEDAGDQQVARIVAKGQEVEKSIPEDYSELSGDVDNLKSAIVQLTEGECTIDGWEMGSLSVNTGEPYDSNTQIRTTKKIGVSTGAGKIVTSGEPLYVLAWDLEGTYIGFYNSNKQFSKVAANYATWEEFDCTIYPDYLFKVITRAKSGITIEEGKNVKFIPLIVTTDKTLSVPDKAADAAKTGEAVNSLKNALNAELNPVNLTGWELGTYLSGGTDYASDTRIRNKTKVGMSKGTELIRCDDGYKFIVLAYDAGGTCLGLLKTSGSFTTVDSGDVLWIAEFPCYKYPTYEFKIVIKMEPDSTSITTADGAHCYFYMTTDKTLSIEGKAADAKATGEAIGKLKSAIVQLTEGECTIDGWEMGSLSVSTGEPYDSNTQIRTTKKIGVSTGAGKIVTSGEPLYVLAWDLKGTYIGFYNSDKKFSKVTAKYATWEEFDCTIYPDYLFKFVTNTKSGVTIEEGKNVKFIPLIVNSINDMPSQIESVNSFRKVTSDDIESGTWTYSIKTADSKRIRSKFLYPVRNGMDVYFTSPTLDLYIGVLTKPDDISVAESGWSTAKSAEQVYHISHDGYAYIILSKPGASTDISVSDFDADIKIFNEQAYYDLINEGNRDLYKLFQRVGVIGDSISVGYIDSNYPIRNLIYSWPKKIMQDAGVPWLNFGYPGFTTLTWCSDLTYGKVQMEAENNKCQAYLICLGCNDEWNTFRHVELGSQSDVVDDPDVVATTYYGGYNRIIQLLKRRNPYCKIFCVTNPVATESLGYNNAVRWIATSHYSANDGVFLLELAWKYRRIINDDAFGIKPDRVGVHYYPFGYRMIGTLMEKALNEIIRDNRSYFSNIAAVPYDTGTPTADTME